MSLDADPAAIARGEALQAEAGGRLTLQQGNFAELARFRAMRPVSRRSTGSCLISASHRSNWPMLSAGFSFAADGPLDMRFGPGATETAAAIVNGRDETELADLIFLYGEERWARRIARAIVRERDRAPIETTGALAAIVSRAVASSGAGRERIHPATRTFQALRIAANRELAVLEEALAGALTALAPGGRLAIIAFHSLEDRIVKLFMRREATDCICPPQLPVCVCDHHATLRLVTRKGIRPSEAEVAENPRSRSATLRVAERLP